MEAIIERLDKIEKTLKINKYDLVFIGEVGSGKTTAICRLFDLVYQKEIQKTVANRVTKIVATKDLMSANAGRTTICEVIVRPSSDQKVSIEIEPYPEQDIKELIEDLCYYIWSNVYPDSMKEDVQPPPAELERAIRNITNLKRNFEKGTDDFKILAEMFPVDKFQSFYDEVINYAQLSQRIEDKLIIPLDMDINKIKDQLNKNFEDLNLGRLPDFSIPRKMYINLNFSILNPEFSSRIGNIVDTRGISADQSRPDLESYIREKESAICLFTDKFAAAPAEAVREIIRRYLTLESQDIASKLVLLVLPRKGEPSKVPGPNGTVDTHEEGIAIRRNDIETIFDSVRVNFFKDNILFYDAHQYYREDGRLDLDYYNFDDVHEDRQRVLEEINKIILNRESALWQEVETLIQNFSTIQRGGGLNQSDYELIENAKENVKKYGFLNIPKGEILVPKYLDLWEGKRRAAMTLRATNARFGVYEPRSIDVYYDAAAVAERIAREFMENPKDKIMKVLLSIKENASEASGLKSMVSNFETQINSYYEALVQEIGKHLMDAVKKAFDPLNRSNDFWVNVQDRFGKGPGYKQDVLSMYADELEDINEFFCETSQNLWQVKLVNKILAFFG